VRPEVVLARVRAIPEGFVATYGDVCPGAPRHAGRVLRDHGVAVPWWRVVRSDGTLAKGDRQAAHLEREGVPLRPGPRADVAAVRIPVEVLDEQVRDLRP
jgi:methylated-DNA-protein-cysteine methyltransferase related protein